jgi:ABC-type phosphate transport system substrate-binding protein
LHRTLFTVLALIVLVAPAGESPAVAAESDSRAIALAPDSASPGPFKLIVHSGTAGSRIPRAVAAAIFLGQVASWGDGVPIKVLDRSLTSPERVAFGRQILGMTTLEMNQYWIRQMSNGKTPPNVEKSDDAVLSFVASTPGAISYVAGDTPTPSGVKVVQID